MPRRAPTILMALSYAMQIALGCVFIYAALPKIQHPYDFLETVMGYQLVQVKLAVVTAAVLPWVELSLGLALLLRVLSPANLVSACGLLAFFVLLQLSAIYRGLRVGCGCFSTGGDESLVGAATVVRTAAILGIAVAAFVMQRRSHSVSADLGATA